MCYNAGLGKWVEVGNSGMFRPEMLLPMGLPREVSVIAWGVSLERYVQFNNEDHVCIRLHSTLHKISIFSPFVQC